MSSKKNNAKKQPYGEWLDSNLVQLRDIKIPNQRVVEYTPEERARLQKASDILMSSTVLPFATWH